MAGRVSKYTTNVKPKLLLIEAWARDGLTEEQICSNLDVSVSAFANYKNDNVELVEALKRGKEEIDVMVENSLLKAALGYEFTEEAIGKDGVYELRKYAHPNTTALIFWLKNRKPKDWRDKQEVEHSGGVKQEHVHDLRKLDPKELAQLEQILAKSADPG